VLCSKDKIIGTIPPFMLNLSKHLILINCDPVAHPGFNSQHGKILFSLKNPD
jgi:hypothetical protein